MKYLIVGDLHIGANEGKAKWNTYMDNTLTWISDIITENAVTDVIFAGDLFDNRKALTHTAIQKFKNFLAILPEGVRLHAVCGNHDSHYKNTNKLNSIELVDRDAFSTLAVDEVVALYEDILLVPWITPDNNAVITEQLNQADPSKIVVGHFEVAGFELVRGVLSKHDSMDKRIMRKFNHVYSGHYHLTSTDGNITFIGSPAELDWNDYGDSKRVILYDSESCTTKDLYNPYRYFCKGGIASADAELDEEHYRDMDVKLYVDVKRTVKIEKMIQKIIDVAEKCTIIDRYTAENRIEEDSEKLVEKIGQLTMEGIIQEYITETYKDGASEIEETMLDVLRTVKQI